LKRPIDTLSGFCVVVNCQTKSAARAWKPVTEGKIYVVLGLFILMGIIQKPTLRSYFTTKRVISTPGFGDIITGDRLEVIYECLHFANSQTVNSFQKLKKLLKIFPVISHLNNKFQELYLPNCDVLINH
jgi:hypothetical protein